MLDQLGPGEPRELGIFAWQRARVIRGLHLLVRSCDRRGRLLVVAAGGGRTGVELEQDRGELDVVLHVGERLAGHAMAIDRSQARLLVFLVPAAQ